MADMVPLRIQKNNLTTIMVDCRICHSQFGIHIIALKGRPMLFVFHSNSHTSRPIERLEIHLQVAITGRNFLWFPEQSLNLSPLDRF